MGTVIAIDFKRRGRTHAGAPKEAPPVRAGALAGCLACLYVPLVVYWAVWLPLAYRREGGHGAASGGADGQ